MALVYFGTAGKNKATGVYSLMLGEGGNDTLISFVNGQAFIVGGEGNDILNYDDTAVGDAEIFGQTGNDIIDGGIGGDRLEGGSGNDLVTGSADNDFILGGSGNDRLYGYWHEYDDKSDGVDHIRGEAGNDQLFGQNGGDILAGGPGKDLLVGGAGADSFWFDSAVKASNLDTIRDFSSTDGDQIALFTGYFITLLPTEGPLDAEQFHVGAKAAELDDRIVFDPAKDILYFDRNGSLPGRSIAIIKFETDVNLTVNDFDIN
jgi:Ca2+-binding RTX toxin-like protein